MIYYTSFPGKIRSPTCRGAEERRQRALEAAEKRSVNVPGISQQKAADLASGQIIVTLTCT